MAERAKSLIERARDVGRRLTEATEQLNTVIARAENVLVELDLGIEASVPLNVRELKLVFKKYKDDWGLFVEDQGDLMPLRKSSRAIRIAAANNFQALFDQIITVGNARLGEVEEALQSANDFVDRH